jgi:hypothetical protein
MKPSPGQQNINLLQGRWLVLSVIACVVSTMREVGLAMINSVLMGYPKQVLEIKDIKVLAKA